MSLLLDSNSTNFTSTENKLVVENFKGRRAVFQERYHYKEFGNPEQLKHVIHDMVVNKGFLMETEKSDMLGFSHPHNTPESSTYYTLWMKTAEVEKVTREFLGFV